MVREALLNIGIDVRLTVHEAKKMSWLREHNIKMIFDIGANIGQFTMMIRKILPDAMIYAFEPLEDCCREFLKRTKGIEHLQLFNCALGDKNCHSSIHHNKVTPYSSLLPMEKLHKKIFPFSREQKIDKVEIRKLDDLTTDMRCEDNILVKIDVQGFEDKVIRGGICLIARAKVIIIETTYVSLYQKQVLFDNIYGTLTELGFIYKGSFNNLLSLHDGRILQSDSIFIKENNK